MVTAKLSIEQIPPDHSGAHRPVRDTITTTAGSYEQARTQLDRQIPDGWRATSVIVDRTSAAE